MSSSKPPGPSKQEKAAQQAQADMLNQQRQLIQDQYKQQQLLAPVLYKQNNIEPIYGPDGFGGQAITGFRDLGPTPEQKAYNELLDIQTRQARAADQLQPLQLEQQGYRLQKDANGNITGLELIPGSIQDLQNTTTRQLLERQQQALAGTLPVDPALQKQFDRSDQILNATLRKNLGEGYATSTPGIQAQAQAASNRENAIYAAQHGEIAYAGQLASQAVDRANANTPYNIFSNTSNAAQFLSPFAQQGSPNARSAQLLGTIGAPFTQGQNGGFGTLAQLYGDQAGQLFRSNQAYNQPQRNRAVGILSGAAGGAAAGAALGPYGAIGGALVGGTLGAFS